MFCKKLGHWLHTCQTVSYLKEQRKDRSQNLGPSGRYRGQQNANKSKETEVENTTQLSNNNKPVEFAGRESLRPPTFTSTDTDHNWNADTGDSAHMTSHQDWSCNY